MNKKSMKQLIKEQEKREKKIASLKKEIRKVKDKWVKGYRAYRKASLEHVRLTRRGTKKEKALQEKVEAWEDLNKELTIERDRLQSLIDSENEALHNEENVLAAMTAEIKKDEEYKDEMIDQVFALTEKVTDALRARDLYFSKHLYDKLIDESGKKRSQLTFLNSDETRKLIVRVNTLTYIDHNHAVDAKREIEKFFARFEDDTEQSEAVKFMFALTRKLLAEKTRFHIGETLYRFLSMEVDDKVFPELKKAQKLLSSGLRSEKSNSYIKLYEKDEKGNFVSVRTS